jgi:hypothetical protein
MGGACSTHGIDEKHMENVWWGNLKEAGHIENLCAGVRILSLMRNFVTNNNRFRIG